MSNDKLKLQGFTQLPDVESVGFYESYDIDRKCLLTYKYDSHQCTNVKQNLGSIFWSCLHEQMISAEAPLVFSKACELFVKELTLRAWTHTEDNKRRTLQVYTRLFVLYVCSFSCA